MNTFTDNANISGALMYLESFVDKEVNTEPRWCRDCSSLTKYTPENRIDHSVNIKTNEEI